MKNYPECKSDRRSVFISLVLPQLCDELKFQRNFVYMFLILIFIFHFMQENKRNLRSSNPDADCVSLILFSVSSGSCFYEILISCLHGNEVWKLRSYDSAYSC